MKRPSIQWLLALCLIALSTFYSCDSFLPQRALGETDARITETLSTENGIASGDTPNEFDETNTTALRRPFFGVNSTLVFHADSTTKAIIGTDDIVLHFEAPNDSTLAVNGTDDIVLHLVAPSDNLVLELNFEEETRTITAIGEGGVATTSAAEADFVFNLDDSFIILDYEKIQVLGTRMQSNEESEERTKGIWEFPLTTIREMRIPVNTDTAQARQLWIYVAREADRDI